MKAITAVVLLAATTGSLTEGISPCEEESPPIAASQGVLSVSKKWWLESMESRELAYFDYVDASGKPRILIVGSGRGSISRQKNYALSMYGSAAPFLLLVNIDKNAGADILCDIRRLSDCLSEEEYDVVIFEHVTTSVAFSRAAIRRALTCLKPGGVLVSSGVPACHPLYSVEERAKLAKASNNSCKTRVNLGEWSLFYENDDKCDDFLFRNTRDQGSKDHDQTTEQKIQMLTEHKETLIHEYFQDRRIDTVQFQTTSEFQEKFALWPRNALSNVEIMIILKRNGISEPHLDVLNALWTPDVSEDIEEQR
ncbi:MAG: class I SAM-dependent methyltransferase [Holosporales bacterium]|jgi:hypothetical protein|nr:class I SAM-dependent methyltransferase [Holosporales bacterium]